MDPVNPARTGSVSTSVERETETETETERKVGFREKGAETQFVAEFCETVPYFHLPGNSWRQKGLYL